MTATECLTRIVENENLVNYPFKYCLVSQLKIPFNINGIAARPNNLSDFCSIDDLVENKHLDDYLGLGISVNASNITAIDIDKCFQKEFDVTSADDRAKDIINMFKDFAYIEFSFSGKGLRIFLQTDEIVDYSKFYYTKNSKTGCEFYQPSGSARYVTITGETIVNNSVFSKNSLVLHTFLEKYMKKPEIKQTKDDEIETEETFDDAMKLIKRKLFVDFNLQEMWFNTNHYTVNGQSEESENDFRLLKYLYEHITRDKNTLKEVFEQSKYFKTKDDKHIKKWEYSNYRYYNYMYDHL